MFTEIIQDVPEIFFDSTNTKQRQLYKNKNKVLKIVVNYTL